MSVSCCLLAHSCLMVVFRCSCFTAKQSSDNILPTSFKIYFTIILSTNHLSGNGNNSIMQIKQKYFSVSPSDHSLAS